MPGGLATSRLWFPRGREPRDGTRIAAVSANPGLDSATYRRHFCQAGRVCALDRPCCDRVYTVASRVGPAALLDRARAATRRPATAGGKSGTVRIRAAECVLGQQMPEFNPARRLALQSERVGAKATIQNVRDRSRACAGAAIDLFFWNSDWSGARRGAVLRRFLSFWHDDMESSRS